MSRQYMAEVPGGDGAIGPTAVKRHEEEELGTKCNSGQVLRCSDAGT